MYRISQHVVKKDSNKKAASHSYETATPVSILYRNYDKVKGGRQNE